MRDKTQIELNPYIMTEEEFLYYTTTMNYYELTLYKLDKLDNNYVDYRAGLLMRAQDKQLALRFAVESKESFIQTFSEILTELIGDDFIAIWEEQKTYN